MFVYFLEKLIEIMSSDCPTEYPEGFYNLYVSLVLINYYLFSREVNRDHVQ